MRKPILYSGAAALAFTAFSAQSFAADPPPPVVVAPVTVASYVEAPRNWTGGYVGGNAAVIRGNVRDGAVCDGDGDYTYAWVTTFFGAVPSGEGCEEQLGTAAGYGSINNNEGFSISEGPLFVGPVEIRGYSIGGQIGYLRQFGGGANGFVIGGEVSANISSASGILLAAPADPGPDSMAFLGYYSVRSYATATLRAGFALGPVLVYAEGGLAIAQLNYTDNIGMNASDMAHGYVYGGGIEGRISDNVSLFFEYNRIHLNDVTMIGTQLGGFLTTYMFTEVDMNVFKTGFNIHFGGN